MLIVPTTRQKRYFDLAKSTATNSTHISTCIGAVIVNGNYVVAKSSNHRKSHTVQHRYDRKTNYYSKYANIHAEIGALIKSGRKDVSGCEIYVYREDAHKNLASSRPCCSCMQAIKDSGIKHIFYTGFGGFFYEKVQ